MKLTVVGDIHGKPDNLDKLAILFDIIEDLGNPTILLGDVLDSKEVVRSKVLNFIFDRLSNSKLQFFILVGNHDYHNLQCEDHSLRVLSTLENVTIISSPVELDLFGRRAVFIPYRKSREEFLKQMKETDTGSTLLIMHQGVRGFDYGNGMLADQETDALKFEDLKGFRKIISGHFHKFQESKNLVYLGTPFSHSFGETNQTKYIGILDSENLEIEYVETPFPKHVTVELDCDDETRQFGPLMEGTLNPTDHIRVILKGPQEKIDRFPKGNFENVKFIERPTEDHSVKSSLGEEDSNEVKFKKWAEEVKKLDKKTIELGLKLLGDLR